MDLLDPSNLDLIGVPVFVLVPDGTGRIVYDAANKAWLSGANLRLEDIKGQTVESLFDARFGTLAYQHHMETALSGQKRTYSLVVMLEGDPVKIRTHLAPICDDVGRVVQIVGTAVEIERGSVAAEIGVKAETLNREIEDFVALAAHDLRTPMRHINGIVEMLVEDFEDHGDGKLEQIEMLGGVATKAMELISDILAHAQAAGAMDGQATFALDQLCMDVFAVLDPMQNHSFVTSGLWVNADRTAIQIILRNLADNAFKHSGKEHVELRISARQSSDGILEISVRDNGHGFPDPSIAFLEGGALKVDSGYGLFGVRRLINARGGMISVENVGEAQGSVVRFTIPGETVAQHRGQTAGVLSRIAVSKDARLTPN